MRKKRGARRGSLRDEAAEDHARRVLLIGATDGTVRAEVPVLDLDGDDVGAPQQEGGDVDGVKRVLGGASHRGNGGAPSAATKVPLTSPRRSRRPPPRGSPGRWAALSAAPCARSSRSPATLPAPEPTLMESPKHWRAREYPRRMARPGGIEPPTLGLEGRRQ